MSLFNELEEGEEKVEMTTQDSIYDAIEYDEEYDDTMELSEEIPEEEDDNYFFEGTPVQEEREVAEE